MARSGQTTWPSQSEGDPRPAGRRERARPFKCIRSYDPADAADFLDEAELEVLPAAEWFDPGDGLAAVRRSPTSYAHTPTRSPVRLSCSMKSRASRTSGASREGRSAVPAGHRAVTGDADTRMETTNYLMLGLFAGVLLRDFGIARVQKKVWPVQHKLLDWQKVQRMANGARLDG